jgi:SagB-type dehydrogenase family enzyme
MNNAKEPSRFSDFHRCTRAGRLLPAEADWPPEWKTIQYKKYPRLRKLKLPEPIVVRTGLLDAIRGRESRRDFRTHITAAELSTILKYSCGITRETVQKRAYASAGARYPLETYIIAAEGNPEIKSGIYHYDIKEHALSLINKTVFEKKPFEELFIVKNAGNASVAIITTAVFRRSANKYGDRGYRFALIEAGEVNQNISLVAGSLSLSCCSVGKIGGSDSRVDELLDIDGTTESYLHSVIIGRSVDKKIDRERLN